MRLARAYLGVFRPRQHPETTATVDSSARHSVRAASALNRPGIGGVPQGGRVTRPAVTALMLWFCACAGGAPALEREAAARAKRSYGEALTRHKKEPRNGEEAWQFARACFDLGEFATNSTERAAFAEQAVDHLIEDRPFRRLA